jgi:hypothetical protein
MPVPKKVQDAFEEAMRTWPEGTSSIAAGREALTALQEALDRQGSLDPPYEAANRARDEARGHTHGYIKWTDFAAAVVEELAAERRRRIE